MKYLMMVQGTQADYAAMGGTASERSPAWTQEDVRAMYAHMTALNKDLTASGEMIDGQGLAEPARTRFVTLGVDGEPVVADGPYGETEEVLAGYRTLAQCSTLQGGGVGHPAPGGLEGRGFMAGSPCPATWLSDLPPDGRDVRPAGAVYDRFSPVGSGP